jgi:predicted MFS family arabinose efflux permease
MSLFASLRVGSFRRLFASAAVSTVGNWLDYVAILVLVTSVWHHGASALAAVSVAIAVPNLAAPFIGVFADRLAPRTAMVTADLSRAAITVGIALAPGMPVLVALVAARAAFSTLFDPAEQRALKRSMDPSDLLRGNALNQAAQQLFKVIGPAAGGALIVFLSPRVVIEVNAASFVISALLLTGLKTGPAQQSGNEARPAGYLAELAEGLHFVLATWALRAVIITISVTVFMAFLFDSMSPLAIRGLGLSSSNIGFFVAAMGVGGVVGALLIAQRASRANPFRLMSGGQLLVGCAAAAMGVGVFTATRLPALVWIAVILAMGLASAGVLVPFPYVVQQATPDALIGRTWTVVGAVPSVLQVLAPPIAAALVPALGVGRLFMVAGGGLAAMAALTYLRANRYHPPAGAAGSGPEGSTESLDAGEEVTAMVTIRQLEAAGFDVTAASGEQRAALESLSDEELQVLISVKGRIDALTDVEAHEDPSGGWLW